MEIACPLSCGFCVLDRTGIDCRDEASDCLERISFCRRPHFRRMMKNQCSRTCQFCQESKNEKPKPGKSSISRNGNNLNV
ncbi:unnamed protein product [Caenorhabditis bovis]|uniref:ShKT domain-containing protein n=1 Tax=Caenorhabditis bovis TaxID=2654633 RepID=A0A8S1EA11_9PELO|nr:unnamed protein product [Caenorhabditis bovis]